MRKLLNVKIVEQSRICAICHEEFTDYNDIVPDHEIPKEWEEHGETTTPTISKQHTGGVMGKRDQPEWMTDGRSVGSYLAAAWILTVFSQQRANYGRIQG